jgi:hypothetical protein
LEILKWAVAQGCHCDFIGYVAALHGHLDIAQWLEQDGHGNMQFCTGAAEGGHLDVLQWAIESGYEPEGDPKVCDSAAQLCKTPNKPVSVFQKLLKEFRRAFSLA